MSEYERQYEDGSDPQVLDVIDVPVLEPRPRDYQTENWLLDPEQYWERTGHLTPADLPALADPVSPLWINGHSTYNGLDDKIPSTATGSVTDSLRLIHVDRLRLVVCVPVELSATTSGACRVGFGMVTESTGCGSRIPAGSGPISRN